MERKKKNTVYDACSDIQLLLNHQLIQQQLNQLMKEFAHLSLAYNAH